MARWHSCNVLQAGAGARHLWQFGSQFALQREENRPANQPLPAKVIGKDWQTLFQPKLNVALLPADKVFLRVLQLPKADYAETQSMVELQLEKVSPVPVAQVVWGFELLSSGMPDMQTAIVIIVARSFVDEFLALLEGQGFLPDRLELPFLDMLRATRVKEDGAWIYTDGSGGTTVSCLVAWWYSGSLQNLSLLHLPNDHTCGAALQAQFAQMGWAGEFEGWLITPPKYRLVANEQTAAVWKNFFNPDQSLEIITPLSAGELAALTAKRVANEDLRTNLLPPEYSARYRQQFIDRLWMRALGAVLMVYIAGITVYLGWVQFAKYRNTRVENQIVEMGGSYTNALQLKDRVRVMQEQKELQFMALDCWKAVADNLPAELTLKSLNFDKGRKLTIMGTIGQDDVKKLYEFNEAMRNNTALFARVAPPGSTPMPGGLQSWSFVCEIKRTGIDIE